MNINKIIKDARDILVGKIPDPKAQVDQITITLIYKFMDAKDKESLEYGGEASYFINKLEDYSFSKIINTPKNDDKMQKFRVGIELLQGIDNTHYKEDEEKLYVNAPNEHIPQLFRDIFKDSFLPYNDPATFRMFISKIDEIQQQIQSS